MIHSTLPLELFFNSTKPMKVYAWRWKLLYKYWEEKQEKCIKISNVLSFPELIKTSTAILCLYGYLSKKITYLILFLLSIWFVVKDFYYQYNLLYRGNQ